MFFNLSSVLLGVLLAAVIMGAAGGGLWLGHSLRESRETVSESFGVLRAAGFHGVDPGLRTLPEPMRTQSLPLLVRYTDAELQLSHEVPDSSAARRTVAAGSALQRPLWRYAAEAVAAQPLASGPRLYEDSLNDMIDEQTTRVAGLSNRVPTEVLLLEIVGAAVALFLLGMHVGVLGRGFVAVLLAAALVTMMMYVTFDLDRPTKGLITVPDTPLVALRTSMNLPPAAGNGP